MHDAILRRAAKEEIVFRDGQKVLTAEDAAQLVAEDLGVAFLTMAGMLRIADRGAIVRPLEDWTARSFLYQLGTIKLVVGGAFDGTRQEAYGGADCETAAAG